MWKKFKLWLCSKSFHWDEACIKTESHQGCKLKYKNGYRHEYQCLFCWQTWWYECKCEKYS